MGFDNGKKVTKAIREEKFYSGNPIEDQAGQQDECQFFLRRLFVAEG